MQLPRVNESAFPPSYFHANAFDHELVILPSRMDGDDGVYPEQAIELLKELRRSGISANWLHDTSNRTWYGERSAIVELIIVPFVVGIGTSAAWAGLTSLFRKKTGQFKLKVGYRRYTEGVQETWIEVEGSGGDVAEILDRLNPWRANGELDPSAKSDEH